MCVAGRRRGQIPQKTWHRLSQRCRCCEGKETQK